MSSDSDDDVPLGARAADGAKRVTQSGIAPLQRAAAGGKNYAESSDDEALHASNNSKGRTNAQGPQIKLENGKNVDREPQSAAQAAPTSVARQAAVKVAAAEMLSDDSRDAARQAAKKQAAVKNSGQKLQKPKAKDFVSTANGNVNTKKSASAKPRSKAPTSSQTGSKAPSKDAKEKKVYDLPGQKKDAPEASDPLRIFYTSTQKQIASLKDSAGHARRSLMSEKWLLEHGLLPRELIEEVLQRITKDSKSRSAPRTPLSGSKRKSMERSNVAKPQPPTRKEKPRSKPAQATKGHAPTTTAKKPLISANKVAAAAKRSQAEAKLAAMAGDDSSDDDMPIAQRLKA